jgi:hypothetical protein
VSWLRASQWALEARERCGEQQMGGCHHPLLTFAAALAGSAALRGQTDVDRVPSLVVYEPACEYGLADMLQAADAFLASLRRSNGRRCMFEFEDAERLNWHFVPRAWRGLPLSEMSADQQALARGILRAGLSQRGYLAASTIIEQASILVRLLKVYLGRMAEPLAQQRRATLERTGFGEVAFAWEGSTRSDEAHYELEADATRVAAERLRRRGQRLVDGGRRRRRNDVHHRIVLAAR